jgi:hypothetical protein
MRSSVAAALALTGIALGTGPVLAQRGGRGGEQAAVRNGWVFSLSAGMQTAKRTTKPLMVVIRCVP